MESSPQMDRTSHRGVLPSGKFLAFHDFEVRKNYVINAHFSLKSPYTFLKQLDFLTPEPQIQLDQQLLSLKSEIRSNFHQCCLIFFPLSRKLVEHLATFNLDFKLLIATSYQLYTLFWVFR